ncbi:MAG: NUDIX domain-containing protein [Chlamydiales bacterium]|nr:NUDIX domain-containing protein [Chlamydiales bacterium]
MIKDFSCGILPLKFDGKKWQVFLVQHKHGLHWAFPKGHPNERETYLEAAARELKEETGLEVLVWIMTSPIMETYRFERDNQHYDKTVYYFAARVTVVPPTLDLKEIIDGNWFELYHACDRLTFLTSKNTLKELESYLEIYKPEVIK